MTLKPQTETVEVRKVVDRSDGQPRRVASKWCKKPSPTKHLHRSTTVRTDEDARRRIPQKSRRSVNSVTTAGAVGKGERSGAGGRLLDVVDNDDDDDCRNNNTKNQIHNPGESDGHRANVVTRIKSDREQLLGTGCRECREHWTFLANGNEVLNAPSPTPLHPNSIPSSASTVPLIEPFSHTYTKPNYSNRVAEHFSRQSFHLFKSLSSPSPSFLSLRFQKKEAALKQACSRHRHQYEPPQTPEHWNAVSFTETRTQPP